MEIYAKLVVLAVIIGLAIGSETAGSKGQISLCGMSADGLRACQPAVAAENPSPPSGDCCSALKSANLQCFCAFKNSGILNRYKVDFKQAMQLPVKCNLGKPVTC